VAWTGEFCVVSSVVVRSHTDLALAELESSFLRIGTGEPMRVLNAVQSYYPFQDRGGPVVKVRALARGLASRGHDVTVLTADLGLASLNGSSIKVQACKWGWRSQEDGVEAIYLPTVGHYRALTINPRVINFCESSLGDFDIVHFYGLYDLLGPAVSHYCVRRGIPYVIEPMGMFRPIDRGFLMKRLWHRFFDGAYWNHAAKIIATSEMEHQELLDDGSSPEKVVIRYNGIDADLCDNLPAKGSFRTKWQIPADEPLVLFLSRLIPRKGAELLIEAFAKACPISGRLVIAGPEGESGYREHLEKCVQTACLERRVIFTGPLYDQDKKAVLEDANLFVLPSRYENFANVAAEAMAFGVPVIVTDTCGIRSLVQGEAGLVISYEKDALAGAIRSLLFNKELYAKMHEGCGRVTAKLSWSYLTEQMEGYYGEVLARENAVC